MDGVQSTRRQPGHRLDAAGSGKHVPAMKFRCFCWIVSGLAVPLWSQTSLSTDSPFVPAGSGEAPPPAAASANGLEFVGVIRGNDGVRFAVYDPSKQMGQWLMLEQNIGGLIARGYDEERRVLTVDIQGQVQSLALKEPKFDSTISMNNRPPGPQVMPALPVPSAADEAARLQAVAEEVKRRRALRQAAAMGQAPGSVVERVPPPPQQR